jgi:hypothetical protein
MAHFVADREHIRTEKEAGAPEPWVQDKVLQTYRFCNVRRRHDRVSKWIIDNIITPYEDNDNLWFMLCCARWLNWPPTIQELMDRKLWPVTSFDPIRFGRVIDERVKRGAKTWTGAYIITARQVPPDQGKGEFIATRMLNPLLSSDLHKYFNSTMADYRTVQRSLELFKGKNGWGTFMAGQVVADMTYSHILRRAPDLYTFAPIGPGSTRGLNRMFGRRLDAPIQQAQFNEELIFTKNAVNEYLGWLDDVTLHDWQNCFCEFDKYLRASGGSGRPRSLYKPETAF